MRPQKQSPTATDLTSDEEIARLRERLAWFESFDELMQKQVGGTGDILRDAIEVREAATDAFQRRSETLRGYRELFSEMLDDITQLQGHAERLARTLTDAIDALEDELLPDVSFPSLPTSLNAEIAATVEPPASTAPKPNNPDIADDFTPTPDLARHTTPAFVSVPDEMSQVHEREHQHQMDQTGEVQQTVQAEPEIGAGGPNLEGGKFVLLAHGVPNAATALSLKSYLEGLEVVDRVEPREFAAGVLRLQLQVGRQLGAQDLAGWGSKSSVITVNARHGLLEIKLV
ncbi:MAG: hypothetical protein AB7V46_03855 [Thermomicrobiales bacterium]